MISRRDFDFVEKYKGTSEAGRGEENGGEKEGGNGQVRRETEARSPAH